MSKIKVIDDAETEVTKETNPDDPWSAESTDTSHFIRCTTNIDGCGE